MPVTGDQQLLKQLNRMALVRQVSAQPGLSRAALADVLGLTKSTVSLLVRELVDQGWLAESALRTTGEVGRRATPLHLDPARLALLGADVGVDEARVVATDLLGNVLAAQVIRYQDARDAAGCIGLVALGLAGLARQLAGPDGSGGGSEGEGEGKGEGEGESRSGAAPRQVLGIGIGLHGAVDERAGILRHAPHLGWRNVDVRALVTAQLATQPAGAALRALPLYMQNEANVAALAEFEFTPQSATDPLIYLSIGYGVGAGVIVSDRLLTGLHGYAGEVGHAVLQVDGPACSCGRRGCADALIGLGALLGEARPGQAALEALFERAGHGDPATCAAVAAAGRQLGVLFNNLWASFDPMAIVVGGAALRLGDALVGPARDVLAGYARAAMLTAPGIRLSHFGADAVAVGAAALARHRLTRPLEAW